jgi:hypothetical protein
MKKFSAENVARYKKQSETVDAINKWKEEHADIPDWNVNAKLQHRKSFLEDALSGKYGEYMPQDVFPKFVRELHDINKLIEDYGPILKTAALKYGLGFQGDIGLDPSTLLPSGKEMSIKLVYRGAKGGKGSGFHGHAGRPGQVGGSALQRNEINYLKSLQKRNVEHVVILDSSGKKVLLNTMDHINYVGTEHEVTITTHSMSYIDRIKHIIGIPTRNEYSNGHLMHNHPDNKFDLALSTEDMQTAASMDLAKISAVTSNGVVYSANRPGHGWPNARLLAEAIADAKSVYLLALQLNRTMNEDERQAKAQHDALMIISKITGISIHIYSTKSYIK